MGAATRRCARIPAVDRRRDGARELVIRLLVVAEACRISGNAEGYWEVEIEMVVGECQDRGRGQGGYEDGPYADGPRQDVNATRGTL